MNFLTPAFLLGALALALPVVFHLIRRSTRERLPFSSLLFLQPTPPRLTKRSRLEDLLLLLLRCLALALLALGFARPFFKKPVSNEPQAGQPKRSVVLVDRSASMQREGLWAAALSQAAGVLNRTTPKDQVSVLAFDQEMTSVISFEEWQAAPPGDRAALARSRLEALKPGWSATQLGTALITAAETLAEADVHQGNTQREVVLISDLQEGGRLEKLQAYDWPKTIPLRVLTVHPKTVGNAGVQVVVESADASLTNSAVRVRVSNVVGADKEQFQVGWAGADGVFVGTPTDVYVPPGQSRVVALPTLGTATNGLSVNRVTLRGDDEVFDNTAYVIPAEPTTLRVLYLGPDAAGDVRRPLFFLRRALPETPRQKVLIEAQTGESALDPARVAEAGIIFVTGEVSAPAAVLLHEAAVAGKTVVFAPQDARPAATLAALLGTGAVPLSEATVKNYAMLTEVDFNHPLFTPFADPRFSDFTKIHVWKHRVVDLTGINNVRVLTKFDSGNPALAEVPVGHGRVVILATGWHPEDSQLGLSTKFVPLIVSLLDYAGTLAGLDPVQHFVGEPVVLPAAATARQIRMPEGTATELAAGATNFTGATRPGIYRIEGGAVPLSFAVNLDPSESRTAPLSGDVFEGYGIAPMGVSEPGKPSPARQLQMQAAEAESRQKLWRWFLLGTLLVLLVETALAGWTARRAIPTEVPA